MYRRLLCFASTALLAGTLTAVSGCSDDSSPGPRCGDGILDPGEECDNGVNNSDTLADTCRTTCELPWCGDGVVDPGGGEECDDGNAVNGDGCSTECLEEVEGCGNGVIDPGEECDDGNLEDGDGCDSQCQSEFCGNGTIEPGEECDDGADNSNTRADACRIDCTLPYCGDDVPDTGEECDDGNNTSGDGCSDTCTFEEGVCGNGVIDPGEECDDGNVLDGDGCDSSCAFEAGTCGNGQLESGEQCDDGNTVDGDGCDATCQLESAVCGNGTVEPGEECDDGALNSNTLADACRNNCQEAHCGDSVVDTGEQCDDGNTSSGDGCDHNCQTEVVPGCGNGTVDPGETCDDGNTTACDGCSASCQTEVCGNGVKECAETCDDGNTTDGDGCDASCELEPITTCQPAHTLTCGDNHTSNTSASGATDNLDLYSCSPWNESGPEFAYIFTAPGDTTVEVRLSGMSSDLDIFVIEDQAGLCEAGNCIEYGGVSTSFAATQGSIYYLVVDGYNGAQGPFSISVTCGACGDGNLDPDEECDDGNVVAGDGCSDTCTLEACGNGTVEAGEECDDGNTDDCDGCSATCQDEACGNGRVECTEECDDGNNTSGDGCSDTCVFEGGTCTAAWDLECGDEDRWSTSNFGATDTIDYYSCVSWQEDGPEYAYSFVAPQSGPVTVTLSELDSGQDLDIFVLTDDGTCDSANCVAYGSLSANFDATAGETYYILVDGFYGDEGNYTVDLACGGGTCGDGVLNTGEACDDNNTTDCDGCSASCTLEECGNGVVECGETCDDGNTVAGDGCSATCQDEAGTCVSAWFLGCGAGDSWNNGAGGSTDNIDGYPACVNWDDSGPEYTYWFYAYESQSVTVDISGFTNDLDIFVLEENGTDGCAAAACIEYGSDSATFNAVAGSYYYFVVDGYEGAVDDYDIDVTCANGAPVCGDGTLDPGEQCDDGNTTDGDGCSASCTLEGGSCSSSFTLACGGTDSWTTEYSDNLIEEYGCTGLTQSGPEYTYQYNASATGTVEVSVTGIASGVDLDLFVLLQPFGGCSAGNCIAHSAGVGDETVQFEALAGETYYIVVDGFAGDEGSYDIGLSCL